MGLLELTDVDAGYGSVPVVDGVSLSVEEGDIVAVLGPNGAGKTTTLRTIAGLVPPLRGTIAFDGQVINGVQPESIAGLGIQFIPEGGGILRGLTVLENLRLSAWLSARTSAALGPRLERVYEVFPVLAERERQPASTLSGGERQMLALAQVIVSDSKLILIDEASLGLSPMLVRTLFDAVVRLRAEGRSILLVEQNAHMALEVADHAYVMEKGRIVDAGTAADVAKHTGLAGLYLGED